MYGIIKFAFLKHRLLRGITSGFQQYPIQAITNNIPPQYNTPICKRDKIFTKDLITSEFDQTSTNIDNLKNGIYTKIRQQCSPRHICNNLLKEIVSSKQ